MSGKRLTQEEFQQRVFEKVGNKYSVIGEYKGRRTKVLMKCNIHNTEFLVDPTNFLRNTNATVSDKCPDCIALHERLKLICAYCGKEFTRAPSKANQSKSGLYFCCREHKDMAQRLDSGKQFSEMRPDHYSDVEEKIGSINTYREMAMREYDHRCSICGWCEDDEILQVHHIDENRQNNALNNLIVLCPNCHAKLTSHKYQLVDRKIIQRK